MKVLVLTIFCLAVGILANPAPSDEANFDDLESDEVVKNLEDKKVTTKSENLDDKFNIKQFLPKKWIDDLDKLEKLGLHAKVLNKLTRAYLNLYNLYLMLGITQRSDPNATIDLSHRFNISCLRPSEELQNSKLPQLWRQDLKIIKALYNSKPKYNELREVLKELYSFLKSKGMNGPVKSLVGREYCTENTTGTKLDLPENWVKALKDFKILGMSSQALDNVTKVLKKLYKFFLKNGLMSGSVFTLPANIKAKCFEPSESYNRLDLPEIWSEDLKIMKTLGMDAKLSDKLEDGLKQIYALLQSKGLKIKQFNSLLTLERCSNRHITKRFVEIEKPQLTEPEADLLTCLITMITDCIACKGDSSCIIKALTNFVSCISKKPEITFF